MNTKLLKQVRDMILKRPRQFDMDDWTASHMWDMEARREVRPSHCGTAACIGGWAIVLAKNKQPAWLRNKRNKKHCSIHTSDIASDVLGLDREQAVRLFNKGYWPDRYDEAYGNATSFAARAKVAARRINVFIRSKGAQ